MRLFYYFGPKRKKTKYQKGSKTISKGSLADSYQQILELLKSIRGYINCYRIIAREFIRRRIIYRKEYEDVNEFLDIMSKDPKTSHISFLRIDKLDSVTRKKEWAGFLDEIKKVKRNEFTKLKSRSYKERGLLKYNFLLTETNMNPTNIGFVDDDYVGLGIASKNDSIISQILEKSGQRQVEVSRDLKVKIKKIIEKLDISLLLDGIAKSDKDIIDLRQDTLKNNLRIENIIDFSKISVNDLEQELNNLGIDKKKAKNIA